MGGGRIRCFWLYHQQDTTREEKRNTNRII